MAAGLRIEELSPGAVLARRAEIAEIWPEASRERIGEILPRHTGRVGFRFLGAFDEDGRLVGFVYGYRGARGQWWHDRVAAALGEDATARWLPPRHFELTELHVRPEARRRGIGGTLHDAILDGLDAPTSVLSTQTDNEPAIRLYEDRGWEIVVPYIDFGSGRAFLIMGKDLSAGEPMVPPRAPSFTTSDIELPRLGAEQSPAPRSGGSAKTRRKKREL